jgi:hypothetical protein
MVLEIGPGRFIGTDELFFKAAGVHWATTGHFAAPEIVGRLSVLPSLDTIYFAQPPAYTFAFGLFIKLFGFGPGQVIAFDCLIHLLLVATTVLLARRVFRIPIPVSYFLGILLLPLGTYGRPDELAMSFANLGIIAWTIGIRQRSAAILAGAFFGLCGLTSIGVCLFLSPLSIFVFHLKKRFRVSHLLTALGSGLLVASLGVSPILLNHPDAYHQILAHAVDQSPELGKPVGNSGRVGSILQSYVKGAKFALRFGLGSVTTVVGISILTFLLLLSWPRNPGTNAFYISFASMLILWLLLPGKYTYLWFFGPWMLCNFCRMCLFLIPDRPRSAIIWLSLGVLTLTPSYLLYARTKAILLTLPKDQKFYSNMEHIKHVIPRGSRVVTAQYWMALADTCQVLDPYFSHAGAVRIDYLIEDGNGSSNPGTPKRFDTEYDTLSGKKRLEVVENNLNPRPNTVGPLRLARGAYGFGALILHVPTVRQNAPTIDSSH